MGTLTPKQKEILDFITEFADKKGYSPSLEEIARKFQKSVPTIFQHIETLRSKGFLTKTDNISRGIQLNITQDEIMLLGRIAAGKPIEPLENPEPIKIPAGMINKPGNYYALRVKGDSMTDEGIFDGDTVIIKHQITANNGEIIVAITEDGATLKTYRFKNDTIILEPKNRQMKSIYPKQLEIRGKLIGLVRSLI